MGESFGMNHSSYYKKCELHGSCYKRMKSTNESWRMKNFDAIFPFSKCFEFFFQIPWSHCTQSTKQHLLNCATEFRSKEESLARVPVDFFAKFGFERILSLKDFFFKLITDSLTHCFTDYIMPYMKEESIDSLHSRPPRFTQHHFCNGNVTKRSTRLFSCSQNAIYLRCARSKFSNA